MVGALVVRSGIGAILMRRMNKMTSYDERMADLDSFATVEDISRLNKKINNLIGLVEELESELIRYGLVMEKLELRNGTLHINGVLDK